MAITAIDIYKDNKVGDCDLLNVASPLVFLVDVTYTTAPPDNLYARLYDKDDVKLGVYRCMPLKDLSNVIRRFAFYSDEILRQYIPPLDDFTQSSGTLVAIPEAIKQFKITFSDNPSESGTAGYHIKKFDVSGLTISTYPYFFSGLIHNASGSGLNISFFVYEGSPNPMTNAWLVDKIKAEINALDPTFLGSKALVYEVTGGYAIRNNMTSDCSQTYMSPLSSFVSCDSFPDAVIEDSVTFNAINAASQIGQYEANEYLFNNEQQRMVGIAGAHGYAYFYDSDGTKTITATTSPIGETNPC